MAESADRVAIAFDPAQIRKAQDRNPFVKISDIVYDILSEAILSSTIAPGSKLNISSIAENLNISHTPVFQAVDRLKNSGLIVESNETSKYHSYRVLDISNESLTNLFTARKAIETTAASICATNVALIDIAQLKKMAAEFRTVWSLYANGRGTSADFAERPPNSSARRRTPCDTPIPSLPIAFRPTTREPAPKEPVSPAVPRFPASPARSRSRGSPRDP